MKKILLALLALLMLAGCGGENRGPVVDQSKTITYVMREGAAGILSFATITLDNGEPIGENIPELTLTENEVSEGWKFDGFYLNNEYFSELQLSSYVPSSNITVEVGTIKAPNMDAFEDIFFKTSETRKIGAKIWVPKEDLYKVTVKFDDGKDYELLNEDAINHILSYIYDSPLESNKRILSEDFIEGNGHYYIEHFDVYIYYQNQEIGNDTSVTLMKGIVLGNKEQTAVFFGIVESGYFYSISEEEIFTIKQYVSDLGLSMSGNY